MTRGDRLTLTIERPAAGGRMIARHDGAVILVSGVIPGEVVEAEIEKTQRGTVWARSVRILQASGDRVEPAADGACGGNVFAHVRYERQLALKREIVRDGLLRIGRVEPPDEIPVMPSPVQGYRMRARLHVADDRFGFFREGTHQLCDASSTGQLVPAALNAAEQLWQSMSPVARRNAAQIELSENCPGTERAFHLVLHEGATASRLGVIPAIPGVSGVSCGVNERTVVLNGAPTVTDVLTVPSTSGEVTFAVSRQAHAFFQANRFLLAPLVAAVTEQVPRGRTLDLYAGVGLFALALARRGDPHVVAIEGDRTSAQDLERNAAAAGGAIETRHQAVEAFLASAAPSPDTIIVDPPRTGMSKEALRQAIELRPSRMVYVSCDIATLARDTRTTLDAGFTLSSLRAFDLFPNTAHVESLAVFQRR